MPLLCLFVNFGNQTQGISEYGHHRRHSACQNEGIAAMTSLKVIVAAHKSCHMPLHVGAEGSPGG